MINNLNNYLKTTFGERFFLISDSFSGFIGLFDKTCLVAGSIMNNIVEKDGKYAEAVREAKGDVLVAGLGIGLIILPIMNKEEVTTLDVVELQQEVIDLISPQLPLNDKVKIIQGDISSFVPVKKYDFIYLNTLEKYHLIESERQQRTKDGVFLDDRKLGEVFKSYLKEGGKVLIY